LKAITPKILQEFSDIEEKAKSGKVKKQSGAKCYRIVQEKAEEKIFYFFEPIFGQVVLFFNTVR
jgi:hypothetical protein